jgi:hypothetical protein
MQVQIVQRHHHYLLRQRGGIKAGWEPSICRCRSWHQPRRGEKTAGPKNDQQTVVLSSISKEVAMRHHLLKISILILIFATMADGVDGQPQDPTQPLPFKPGQSVYIVAMKSNCSPDFRSESVLKEEFEKQKVFGIATSLQSADFVFVVYLDYEAYNGTDYLGSVTAFAVSPTTYTRFKSDPYNLRDEALWRSRTTKGFPKKVEPIVKMFHEDILKK